MSHRSLTKLALSLRRLVTRLARRQKRADSTSAIDVADPLGRALRDANLLIAFAAQSRRGLNPEKVKSLSAAIEEVVNAKGSAQQPAAAQLSAFWIAYDAIAVDMSPLSAHSIRSSVKVNELRFPHSLIAPTAYNSALAVVVFLVCLALQGFWVAGKELIDRSEFLEKEKVDIQKKIDANVGILRRSENRRDVVDQKLCAATPKAPCDYLDGSGSPVQRNAKPDLAAIAALKTEWDLVRAEVFEKTQIEKELSQHLTALNDRSRPLEDLLVKWHERARLVCDTWYLKFLCPVDNPEPIAEEGPTIKDRLRSIREAQHVLAEPGRQTLSARIVFMSRQAEIRRLEQELAAIDAHSFRSKVVEVRIIAANIATYLIAMAMGILGALTFILRTLSQQLRDHTYVPVSASISIVRICLGAIAGVFGSLLLPTSDSTLKSLPPLFVPFVFGYGIEILFSLLDKIVRSFAQSESTSGQASQRLQ